MFERNYFGIDNLSSDFSPCYLNDAAEESCHIKPFSLFFELSPFLLNVDKCLEEKEKSFDIFISFREKRPQSNIWHKNENSRKFKWRQQFHFVEIIVILLFLNVYIHSFARKTNYFWRTCVLRKIKLFLSYLDEYF
jgi:hypothetical protein